MKTDFNLPQSLIDAVTKVAMDETFKPTSPAEMVAGDTVKVHKPGYALHGKTCKIKGFSGSTAELEHANQTYHVHQKHLAVQESVENLDEATVSRKHFQQVADVIKAHPDQEKRNELAKHHAGIFAAANPRFDHKRFYSAAGATLSEDVIEEESVTIEKPGHRFHGQKAKVFFKHPDGRVNAQLTHSSKKGDVTNLTLKPGEFKSLHEGAVPVNQKQKIYIARNGKGEEVSRHTTREAAEAQSQKYGGTPKLAEETEVLDERVEVTKDKTGKLISWKAESEWRKRTKKDARGVVTHDSDKARRTTEKLTKEETETIEEANFPGDIRNKISTYKKMGLDVQDVHVGNKDGKDYAHYTVIDKEGIGRKHIHHGDSKRLENLGQVRAVKDDTDEAGEKVAKRRGRPPKDKFAAK